MVIFFGEFDPRVVEDLKRMKMSSSGRLRSEGGNVKMKAQ
jgi:hypothetical protein